ncbi:MAG: hypothetical protein JWO24_351 [Rhodospirillales bacterium]|jgi:hypothetical protein|nr:hypothetical protein [Rhodospirillales bacterium]
MTDPTIRRLDAAETEARINALSMILTDAVAHGASVNFLAAVDPTITESS